MMENDCLRFVKSFTPFFQPRVENVATFMSRGGTICGQYLKSQFSGSKTFPLLIVQGTREDLIRISSLPLFYDRSFFVTMIKHRIVDILERKWYFFFISSSKSTNFLKARACNNYLLISLIFIILAIICSD